MLIVPDTNVLIAGSAASPSYTGQIVSAWRQGIVEFGTCEEILAELREVLDYPQVEAFRHWTRKQKEAFVVDVRKSSIVVAHLTLLTVTRDADDDIFFACAVAAEASYIVSKDKHILDVGEYQGIKTVKPGYFVEQVLKKELAKAA